MHPKGPPPQAPPVTEIPGVTNVIAIGSGKGGVGKTTVSVNLALSLAKLGKRVGLLDADVYGPNVPTMMGVQEAPTGHAQSIRPIEKHGMKIMSIGFLKPGDDPLVWRGPMLHNIIQQFLRNVEWGELDYLLIDMPPGTGDVALSLVQTTKLAGAIVVSTPSAVSLEDARKAINMFHQVKVPILGLVENMSYLIAPGSGERIDVFGQGGGKQTANAMHIPFLGELALDPEVRIGGDSGDPVTGRGDDNAHAAPYLDLAKRLDEAVGKLDRSGPKITIED